MKTGDKGKALIKEFEGFEDKAYPDPKKGGAPYTIGWGTTRYPSGMPVKPGDTATKEKAEQYLANDLVKFEAAVTSAVKVPLTQNQFDALVSFTYNLGAGNLNSSTLLKMLNAGDYKGAADQFMRWVSPGSAVEAGLRRRRTAERALFLS